MLLPFLRSHVLHSVASSGLLAEGREKKRIFSQWGDPLKRWGKGYQWNGTVFEILVEQGFMGLKHFCKENHQSLLPVSKWYLPSSGKTLETFPLSNGFTPPLRERYMASDEWEVRKKGLGTEIGPKGFVYLQCRLEDQPSPLQLSSVKPDRHSMPTSAICRHLWKKASSQLLDERRRPREDADAWRKIFFLLLFSKALL
ncbi:hypothetical protein NPIL_274451 [Nephila pilipes]|uniref:Uncharacterized protein n=1 Tax=Nephila pilipes TaxID=299642 RepID=A0A8X6NNV0_NEPPI|nr:hypothetical protein NPIL_274451 [Nephila pilipes]